MTAFLFVQNLQNGFISKNCLAFLLLTLPNPLFQAEIKTVSPQIISRFISPTIIISKSKNCLTFLSLTLGE